MGNAKGKMVVFKKEQSGYTNECFIGEDLHGSIQSNISLPACSATSGKQNYIVYKLCVCDFKMSESFYGVQIAVSYTHLDVYKRQVTLWLQHNAALFRH